MLPSWATDLWAMPSLDAWHTHALAFLLGSYAVATLSDLKYLSAQREFLEVWVVAVLGLFLLDLWQGGWPLPAVVYVKWGTILLLSLLSWHRVGVIFRLARGDVWALAATAALLPPVAIVAYWAAAWLIAKLVRPLLSRGRGAWPFMPVVSLATLGVLLVFALGILTG